LRVRQLKMEIEIKAFVKNKKDIEKKLGVKINLDSKTGDCEILPKLDEPNYKPLNVYTAQKIVNAINRGFNPIKAMKLIEDDYDLEVFNLFLILGKSEKRIKRVKGRIIGRNGEIRKALERFTECYVSVYGKTVSVIAAYENLQIARKAINMIIKGIPHHTVLKFIENKYNDKKKEEFRQMYKPEF